MHGAETTVQQTVTPTNPQSCATRVQPTMYKGYERSQLLDLQVSGIQTITETFRQDNYSKFDSEFSTENGLANSRFHTLLFGINRLRSDELLHFGQRAPVREQLC